MFGFRPEELIIILVIVALLFGAKRLPEISRSLGQSIHNFRKGVSDLNQHEERGIEGPREENRPAQEIMHPRARETQRPGES